MRAIGSHHKRLFACFGLTGLLALVAAAPADASTVNAGSVSQFDAASEIDVSGSFAYAINYTDTGAESSNYTVGDATFKVGAEAFSGASDSFDNAVNDWKERPDFGSDDNLEDVMYDIEILSAGSIGDAPVDIDLEATPGAQYKLQMLFKENRGNTPKRVMDIWVEADPANDPPDVDALDIVAEGQDSGETPPNNGLVYTRSFTAGDSNVDIRLDSDANDSNGDPILNGLTLETVAIPEPASLALLAPAGLLLLRRRRA